MTKNSGVLWKSWKSKFRDKNKTPSGDDQTDPASIADLFVTNMQKLYRLLQFWQLERKSSNHILKHVLILL